MLITPYGCLSRTLQYKIYHIVTLDKNEKDYKGQLERANYTKIKNVNDEIK